MVVCRSRNGFVQIALQLLSKCGITSTTFKLNVTNDINRQVIIDTIEVPRKSIQISNGLYIDNIRYLTLMKNYRSLHAINDCSLTYTCLVLKQQPEYLIWESQK